MRKDVRSSLTIALALALGVSLVACGGGGVNSTPVVSTPANPAAPVTSPTPTTVPSTTPTSSPIGLPTSSPTPTTTPTSSPTASSQTVYVGMGATNGEGNMIRTSAPNDHGNSGAGDLEPGDPGATTQGGGQGSPVDGISCDPSMSGNYHVHFFVGLYVNGSEIAIPAGIGMVDPYPQQTWNGIPNQIPAATCFYHIHTHDASGEVHMEAPSPTCGAASSNNTPCDTSIFALGNFLDVWGISMSLTNFGPFQGPVQIYTTPPGYNYYTGCNGTVPCTTPSTAYSLYTGDPRQIALYSHTTIWILVGTGNPTGAALPNIAWNEGDP